MEQYDGISLFSGGLDSVLAARLLMEQGKKIKCLHFHSPFFGHPKNAKHWEEVYGLDIDCIDIGEEYVAMLQHPAHGFGSAMNPCVDCKIVMLKNAKRLLQNYGASFIVTGEVLGQRPMSQRRDTLNIIRREAEVQDLILRPLCALHLDPTPAEESGLVDRSKLLGISGRGRKDQLALAEHFGITEIPTPGGGCKLTEKENTRRFWPVLAKVPNPDLNDFLFADSGRQFWYKNYRLAIGRHKDDNQCLLSVQRPSDLHFKMIGFPGPIALGRSVEAWTNDAVQKAADLMASYSPKAVLAASQGEIVSVRITRNGQSQTIQVHPNRESDFKDPTWEEARADLELLHKQSK